VTLNNPNAVQYGGDHYHKAGMNQHWDMLPVFGYGWEYYIGRATAYLTRVKQPELDPQKAGHFVDKLVWLIDNGWVPPVYARHGHRTTAELHHYLADVYFPANAIRATSDEAAAITMLMFATNRADLVACKQAISRIERIQHTDEGPAIHPTAGYVDQDRDNRTYVFGDSAVVAAERDPTK